MAVYRVERTRDYTVMSNHHLKDPGLSLKAKGLLAIMLSLPDDWNYSTRGLAAICKEGVEAIGNTLKELEKAGYVVRRQLRGEHGRVGSVEYTIYEKPNLSDKHLSSQAYARLSLFPRSMMNCFLPLENSQPNTEKLAAT